MAEISISLQAEPRYLPSWLTLARRAEAGGFEALLVGDHPGSGSSPWAALGSAAAVTERLRLGTCVSQAGVREPMHLAATTSIALLLPQPDGAIFGLASSDAAADHAALQAAGVQTGELIPEANGVPPMFSFTDPFGNTLRVSQR